MGKTTTTENQIRDHLVDNLEILEPGLRLIAKEFTVPNPLGAAGRIDILARDLQGNFVVVELKRSDASARTALHELFKYICLLQSEKGIPDDRLRCILVSTEWRELRVPFSEFVATSPYSVCGLELRLDSGTGLAAGATMVRPVPTSDVPAFPVEFVWPVFGSAEDRTQFATESVEMLAL